MAVTKGGFEIPIAVDDQASSQFKRIQAAAKKFIGSMGQVGAAVVVANQGFQLLGTAVRQLERSFNVTVKSFANFQTAMVGVQKTTDLSDSAMVSFSKSIQDMSQRIPVGAVELGGLAEAAGQLGVTGSDNLLLFTETMAKVGVATDLAGSEGAKAIARILGVTEQGVENVDRFSAALVDLGNTAKASESEIITVATTVARSTAQFGLASTEVLAISTAMKEVGIQAQLGGSAVGKTFRTMTKVVREGGAELKTLVELTGQTRDELKANLQDAPAQVFQSLIEGLQRSGDSAAALERIGLAGDEINSVIPVLAKNAENLASRMDQASRAYEENTALNKEAERAFATLNSQLVLLGNTFSRLGTTIGAALAPAVTEIITVMTDLGNSFIDAVNGIDDFITALDEATPALLAVAGAMTTTIAVMSFGKIVAATAAFGGLGSVALAAATNLTILAVALTATLVPLAVIAIKFVAISLAILAVIEVISIFTRNWDNLGEVFTAGIEIMVGSAKLLALGLIKAMTWALSLISDKFDDFSDFISGKMDDTVADIQESTKKIKPGIVVEGFDKIGKSLGLINEEAAEIDPSIRAMSASSAMAAKQTKTVSENLGDAATNAKLTKEQVEALNTALDRNAALQLGIANTGASEVQRIQNQLAVELKAVDTKQARLTAEGKISKELVEQLKLQKQLLNDQARLDIAKALLEADKQSAQVAQTTTAMQAELNNLSATNAQQIDNTLAVELKRLELKRQILEAEGKLTPELEKQLQLNEALLSAKAGKQKEAAATATADAGPGVTFDSKQVEQISNVLGESFGGAASAISSAAAPMMAVTNTAMMAVSGLQAIVDAGPQLLDAITGLLNSVAELPLKIAESFSKLLDSIINVIKNLIPNLLKSIGNILMDAAIFLAEELPEAALGLVEALPGIITDLLTRLPDIISKLALGLIRSGPLLAIKLIGGLAKGIPTIIKSLISAMPEMGKELAGGLSNGVKEVINEMAGALGLADVFHVDTGDAEKAIADLGETVSRSTSNVFAVTDLAAEAKGLDVADRIRDAVASGTSAAAGILEKLWNALKAVWVWIRDKVLMPIWDAIMGVWEWVRDKILMPIWDALMAIWDAVFAVLEPLFEGLGAIFQAAWDAAMIVFEAVAIVFQGIWDAAMVVFEVIVDLFSNAWEMLKVVVGTVVKLFSNAWNTLKRVWDILMDLFTGKIDLFTAVGEIFEAVFDHVISSFTILWEGVGALFDGIMNGLAILWEGVGQLFDNYIETLSGLWDKVGEMFNNAVGMFNDWKDTLVGIFNKLTEPLRGFIEDVTGFEIPEFSFPDMPTFDWPDFPSFEFPAFPTSLQDVFDNLFAPLENLIQFAFPEFEFPDLPQLTAPDLSIPKPAWLTNLGASMGGFVDIGHTGKKAAAAYKKTDLGKGTTSAGKAIESGGSKVASAANTAFGTNFSSGGMKLPGGGKWLNGTTYLEGGGVSATPNMGTDIVNAKLTPGEFVVNREATRNNLGLLSLINETRETVAPIQSPTTISVVINAKTSLDANSFKRDVMPAIERELRRKSQEGKFILSSSGVRS